MHIISSRKNPKVAAAAALAKKTERESRGQFLIEGPHCVTAALDAGWHLNQVFFLDDFLDKKEAEPLVADTAHVECYQVPKPVMERLCTTRSACPVLAVARQKELPLDLTSVSRKGLVVVADRISDPGNLGTMIRLAAAVNASGMILCGDACDPFNPKVIRGSMGASFHLPLIAFEDAYSAIALLKEDGFAVVATAPGEGNVYTEVKYPDKPLAVVLGEESSGLDKALLGLSDVCARIPISDKVESLNIAISAAVLLYEVVRQRGGIPSVE